MTNITALELIEETAKYYSENTRRRAVQTTAGGFARCRYETDDGRRCGVGRLLTEEGLREALNASATDVDLLLEDGVLHVGSFKEKYRHLVDAELMSDVQILHDGPAFWEREGLTGLGRAKLGQLRETYERRTQS